MRRRVIIAIRVGYVLIIAALVYVLSPSFLRGRGRSGPTPRAIIWTHLEMINDAKENLKNARHLSDDYWPTRVEIVAAYTGQTNRSFDDLFKPSRWGEVYIVNRLGAPPYAYLSNKVGGFPEGCLLTSADLLRPYGSIPQQNDALNSAAKTNWTSNSAEPQH